MACSQQQNNNNGWFAQGIATAAVYGCGHLVVAELYKLWTNYGALFANAPGLHEELERVGFVLDDMKYIFSDEGFNNVLTDGERRRLGNV